MKTGILTALALLLPLCSPGGEFFHITFSDCRGGSKDPYPTYTDTNFVSGGMPFHSTNCQGFTISAGVIGLRIKSLKTEDPKSWLQPGMEFNPVVSRIRLSFQGTSADANYKYLYLDLWDTYETEWVAFSELEIKREQQTVELQLTNLPPDTSSEQFRLRLGSVTNKEFAVFLSDLQIWTGEVELGVGFDKQDGFSVYTNGTTNVTAHAVNEMLGSEISYVWKTNEWLDTECTTATLQIDPDKFKPDQAIYTNWCEITAIKDETAQVASNSISFEVVPTYSVSCQPELQGGRIDSAVPAVAEAGTPVFVNASPSNGYYLACVYVNSQEIVGTEFSLPASDVLVSASFLPLPEPGSEDFRITFDDTTTSRPKYASLEFSSTSNFLRQGETFVSTNLVFPVLNCYGGDANSELGGKALRVRNASGTNGFFRTDEISEFPIRYFSFLAKNFNTNQTSWLVSTSPDGTDWTDVLAIELDDPEPTWHEFKTHGKLPAESRYFRFSGLEPNSSSTAKAADIDELCLIFNGSTMYVTLSRTNGFSALPGEQPEVVATVSGADPEDELEYQWYFDGNLVADAVDSVFTNAPVVEGRHTNTVEVVNLATGDSASKSVWFRVRDTSVYYRIELRPHSSDPARIVAPARAKPGTIVQVGSSSPDYVVKNLYLNGIFRQDTDSFTMPNGDIRLSVDFVPAP